MCVSQSWVIFSPGLPRIHCAEDSRKGGTRRLRRPYLVLPFPAQRRRVQSLYISNKNKTELFSPGAWITPATCRLVLSWSTPKENQKFQGLFFLQMSSLLGVGVGIYFPRSLALSAPAQPRCCVRDPGARPPAKTSRPDLQVLLVGVGHGKGRKRHLDWQAEAGTEKGVLQGGQREGERQSEGKQPDRRREPELAGWAGGAAKTRVLRRARSCRLRGQARLRFGSRVYREIIGLISAPSL